MKKLQLISGNEIPALGLGTWQAERGKVYQAIQEAIKIGYRHIDCAAVYGNEQEIGQALQEVIGKEVTREELFITSKLWNDSHLPEHVVPALKKSLSDLQLEHLDLYLIHWPVAFKKGVGFAEKPQEFLSLEEAPLIDTWQAMEEARKQGLVKDIGVSNFSIKKMDDLHHQASVKPAVNQVELHPYLQQDKLVNFAQKNRIVLTAYSPLGSRQSAKKTGEAPSLLEEPIIKEIAQAQNATEAQVLIRWALERGTAVIPKSTNPQRIQENFEAATLKLSGEEMAQIATLDKHYRFIDASFFASEGSPYTTKGIWDE